MKLFGLKLPFIVFLAFCACSVSVLAADAQTTRYLNELSGTQNVDQKWLSKNAAVMEEFFTGRYTFQSKENEDILYFPSTNRNLTDSGYQNYEIPPEPWYAKIPKETEFSMTFKDGQLIVKHVSLFGAYVPSQLGKVVESKVTLSPMSSSEKVTFITSSKKLIFNLKKGVPVVGGCKVEITLKKLANGDILLTDFYKGWAIIPAPIPITETRSFIIKRVK